MRKFTFIGAAAGILTLAGAALAAEWDKEGKVGDIIIHAGWAYDEFKLAGSPNICASPVAAEWRHRVRFNHGDALYETVSKTLLAAKLSGARVKITAESSAERCFLKDIVVLE